MAWEPTYIGKSKLIFFQGSKFEEHGLEDLLHSTAEFLGKGTFGSTYKADLQSKNTVAVKRLKGECLSENEFIERVQDLGRMDHPNLLPIKAYCCHRNERLILYDYKHLGSLDFALHGQNGANKSSLNWEVRSKIAYAIAKGINYLHTQGLNVCHGNITSSNVLLTHDYAVQISEHGMARLISPDSYLSLVGGYCAPEVMNAHKVSQKSDVYSFGVVLLELLTGKTPLDVHFMAKGIDLPKWIRSMFQEKPLIEVFDDTLHNSYENGTGEQMVQLLQLAVCCTFKYPNKRPSMDAVTKRIKETCTFKNVDLY